MATVSRRYRFVRSDGVRGFFSHSRPSTDAMSALGRWCAGGADRTFEVVEDTDDFLVARVSIDDGDRSAGDDLDQCCRETGVMREPVP